MAIKALAKVDSSSSLLPKDQSQSAGLTPTDEKVDSIGEKALSKSLGDSPVLEHVLMAGDIPGAVQKINNLVDVIHEKGIPTEYSVNQDINGAGIAGLTVAGGFLNILRGQSASEKSHKTGDEVGLFGGLLRSAIRGPSDIIRGGSSVASNSISMAGKATSLSKVVTALGFVTIAGTSLGCTVITATAIANIVEARSIAKTFNKKVKEEGDKAGFDYLKEMLSITEGDKTKVLEEIFDPKPKSWHKRALNYIGNFLLSNKESESDKKLKIALKSRDFDSIKELLKGDVDLTAPLSADEVKVEGKLQEIPEYGELTPNQARQLIKLVSGLYQRDLDLYKEKKEVIFSRAVGSSTKDLMNPFMKEGSEAPEVEKLKEIVTSAKAGLVGHIKRMGFIIAGCIFTIVVSILAQAMTGGIYALVELGVGIIISAIWLGIDGYYLYQAYKESHADWKDRALMLLATVGVVVIGSLVASFARSSLTSIVLTATMLSVYLCIALYQVVSWKKTTKEKAETPSVVVPDEGYISGESLVPQGLPRPALA